MKKFRFITIIFFSLIALSAVLFACGEEKGITLSFVTGEGATQIEAIVVGGDVRDVTPLMPRDPTRQGYIFDGWFANEARTTPFNPTTFRNSLVLTVYARWVPEGITAEAFTVRFNSNGGTGVHDIPVNPGGTIADAPVTTRTGFLFLEWQRANGDSVEFPFTVTGNTTLFARWRQAHTVTFNSTDGTAVLPVVVGVNERVPRPDDPTRSGNTFWAWYTEHTYQNQWNFDFHTVTRDITLFARWENAGTGPSVRTVNVPNTERMSAEISLSSIRLNVRNDVTSLSLEDMLTFTATTESWTVSTDAGGAETVPKVVTSIPAGQSSLYLHVRGASASQLWTVEIYRNRLVRLNFFENFAGDGAGEPMLNLSGSNFEENTVLNIGTPQPRQHYTFGGWFLEPIAINRIDFSRPLTSAATRDYDLYAAGGLNLFAFWIPDRIGILFDYNVPGTSPPAGFVSSGEVSFDSNFIWRVPSRTGFRFDGWFSASESGTRLTDANAVSSARWTLPPIAGGYRVYARWVLETYNIIYNLGNDESDPEDIVRVGDDMFFNSPSIARTFNFESIIHLPVPTRVGHTFGGWFLSSNFVGATMTGITPRSFSADIVLFARWMPRTFNVSYNLVNSNFSPAGITEALHPAQNSTVNPSMVRFTDGAVFLSAPTRTGCVFAGWILLERDGSVPLDVDGFPIVLPADRPEIENPDRDYVFVARWELRTYAVTFDMNDSELSRAENNASNVNNLAGTVFEFNIFRSTSITLSPPSRPGYTFSGWTRHDGVRDVDSSTIVLEAVRQGFTPRHNDFLVRANWSPLSYTLVYQNRGNLAPASQTVSFGADFILGVPSRQGFDFAGWFTESDGGGEQLTGADGRSLDVWSEVLTGTSRNVYAFWTSRIYTVTLDAGLFRGNANNFALSETMYESIRAAVLPTGVGVVPVSDNPAVLPDGTPDVFLEVPVLSGYTFVGWRDTRYHVLMTDGDGKMIRGLTTESILITSFRFISVWMPNSITVTLNAAGGTISGNRQSTKDNVVYDSLNVNLGTPDERGRTHPFFGWMDCSGNLITGRDGIAVGTWAVAENITLYANWFRADYRPILNAEQFLSIGAEGSDFSAGGSFFLVDDIDLEDEEITPLPVFSGILNGNGFAVRNFRLNHTVAPTANAPLNIGLFSENRGSIINLGIEDFVINVNISNPGMVGVINAGAFAGENFGSIQNSFASGRNPIQGSPPTPGGITVNAVGRAVNAGGIAGTNNGGISSVWARVDIFVTTTNENHSVSGTGFVGGITGLNNTGATVSHSLAAPGEFTPVEGTFPINRGGMISNNSRFSGISSSGGVAGRSNGVIQSSFVWDGVFFEFLGDNKLAPVATTQNLRSNAWYAESLLFEAGFWNVEIDGNDVPAVKVVDVLPLFTYRLILDSDAHTYGLPVTPASGTRGNPVLIVNIDQLRVLQSHHSARVDADFSLAADDDWVPIGTEQKPFSGIFSSNASGMGRSIGGLRIRNLGSTPHPHVGLFGVNTGTIERITLTNANIEVGAGTRSAGIIVGTNAGFVENVSLTGTSFVIFNDDVTGGVGGIAGQNYGLIYRVSNNSTSGTAVSGFAGGHTARSSGGIAGLNHLGGRIDNAISSASVTAGSDNPANIVGNSFAGGIAGTNAGEIRNVYTENSGTGSGETRRGDIRAVSRLPGQNYTAAAGGIAGVNTGTISQAYTLVFDISAFAVSPSARALSGGIAGHNQAGGIVRNTVVIADWIRAETVPYGENGFAGSATALNEGSIFNSFKTSDVRIGTQERTGNNPNDLTPLVLSDTVSAIVPSRPKINIDTAFFQSLEFSPTEWETAGVSASLNRFPRLRRG
jgi:uncharacterized repeat protein (TIGR02543 family)